MDFSRKKTLLTKTRPLFTLSHRRSDNFPLLIIFSATYINQSIVTFMRLKVGQTTSVLFKITVMRLKYARWLVRIITHYASTKYIQSSLKHDMWWGDTPCDSLKRGLTLVRLKKTRIFFKVQFTSHVEFNAMITVLWFPRMCWWVLWRRMPETMWTLYLYDAMSPRDWDVFRRMCTRLQGRLLHARYENQIMILSIV